MKPTPIYKDHTGQWREKNPNFKSGGRDKEIEETKAWHVFEQSITYHPFPNEPNVKQGELVMARLQWQSKPKEDNFEWDGDRDWQTLPIENNTEVGMEDYTGFDDFTEYVNWGFITRQIWVAANQANQEHKGLDLNKLEKGVDEFIANQTPESYRKEFEAIDQEGKEEQAKDFQSRVLDWLIKCFGAEIAKDILERNDRFIEESLELAQSLNYSADRAHALVDYVFNRDKGQPFQEVGGVMVTLAALCSATGLNMMQDGEIEYARINKPEIIEKIRKKQTAKPTGSALPVPSPSAQNVEVSADAEKVATNYFLSTGYRPNDDYISYKNGFVNGANWATSSLQQQLSKQEEWNEFLRTQNENDGKEIVELRGENEDLKVLQDQLSETYDKMVKENDKLREEAGRLKKAIYESLKLSDVPKSFSKIETILTEALTLNIDNRPSMNFDPY